jgi:hypothetical protein
MADPNDAPVPASQNPADRSQAQGGPATASACDVDRCFICKEIKDSRRRSRNGQRSWSFLNHGATIAIIVFSAGAAVLAQHSGNLDSIGIHYSGKNIATILSLLVAIITSIQTKIAFERKWIANRMTQSALSQLRIDAKMAALTPDVLAQKYKEILDRHDKAITTGN